MPRFGKRREHLPVAIPSVKAPDEKIAEIDGYIIRTIEAYPGCPATNIIGGITQEYHSLGIVSEPLSHNVIPSRLHDLAESGEIVRLRAVDAHKTKDEYLYYPKDWMFETTPATQFINGYQPPAGLHGVLDTESQIALDSILGLLSICEPRVRLRVINKFCIRCGAIKEGHYCNE